MKYNICFSSSNIYIPFCIAAIESMLMNNTELSRENTTIHLLSNEISEENIDKLKVLLEAHNVALNIINISHIKKRIEELNLNLEFNISSVLRLFIAELLPTIDKVLFIDSDTYIQNGITTLYDVDISNAPCAMVLNQPIYKEFLIESDLTPTSPYYNAGVMLINLDFWRKQGIQEKLIEYYKKKGHFSVDDQGVLNGVLAESTIRLPYKYNAMKPIFTCNYKRFCRANLPIGYSSPEEFYEAKNNPVIVHFNGPALRPWMRWCAHPFTSKFRKCLYRHYPEFKLWKSSHTKSFVFKQYIWNRFLCRIMQYFNL